MRLDIVLALRSFRRQSGIYLVAVGGLAVAIAASTAALGILYAVTLRPVGVVEPDRAIHVWRTSVPGTGSGWSLSEYLQLRDLASSVTLEAWQSATVDWEIVSADRRTGAPAMVAHVSGGFFDTFGGGARIGRVLGESDVVSGSAVAVVSYGFWRRELGADPAIVGATARLSGEPVVVIGVADRAFTGPVQPEAVPAFWLPLQASPGAPGREPGQPATMVRVGGRLFPDVSAVAVQAQLSEIVVALSEQAGTDPASAPATGAVVVAVADQGGRVSALTAIVVAAVTAILLLAGANLATVLIAVFAGRRSEIELRFALGARRWRIVRQFVIETFVPCALAGALGFTLAYMLVPLIAASIHVPTTIDVTLDHRVMVLTVLLVAAMTAAIGTRAARHGINLALAPYQPRWRTVHRLNGVQATVSMTVLGLATMFVMTATHVAEFDFGFNVERLAAASLERVPQDSKTDDAGYWRLALDATRALPGVETAALAMYSPLTPRDGRLVHVNATSDGYFETLGLRVLQGRSYTPAEVQAGARVAVISANLARAHWEDQNPLGQTLRRVDLRLADVVVVGVVADATTNWIGEPDVGTVYHPLSLPVDRAVLVARSRQGGASILQRLHDTVEEVDPTRSIRTWAVSQSHDVQTRRMSTAAAIAVGLGGVALSLAVVGLVGAAAFAVVRRRAEIGVRVALGARRSQIVLLLLGQLMRSVAAGVTVGLGIAIVGWYLVGRTFPVVDIAGPMPFAIAALILLVAAASAVIVPVRRALSIEPADTLKQN